MRRSYSIILFFILFIWFAGIFANFFVKLDENLLYAIPFLKKNYSLVCHQDEHKLISFASTNTFVCARCTGIYLGLLFTSAIFLLFKTAKKMELKFLILASMPMISDVILHSLNFYPYSKTIAFTTGLLFGSVGFLYLYNGLNQLFIEIKR